MVPARDTERQASLHITRVFSIEKFCFCTRNLESLFIEVTNFNDQGPMYIGVIYRPPNGDWMQRNSYR